MAGQSSQSDTAGNRISVWPPKRLDALLDHLEANKGEEGLYMRDRSTAYDGAVEHLAQMTDLKPVSRRQIQDKFSAIWGAEKRKRYKDQPFDTLFQQGRQALSSRCQKASMEQKVREGWQTLCLGPSKSVSVAVTVESPRTSSPSKNQASEVSRNSASLGISTASALGKRDRSTSSFEYSGNTHKDRISDFSDSIEVSNNRSQSSLTVWKNKPPASRSTKENNTTNGSLPKGTQQRPKSPPFDSEEYSPLTPENLKKVSRASLDYYADGIHANASTPASPHEGTMQRVFPALADLLENDPDRHLLSPKYFERSLDHIIHLIRSTIEDFLEAADIDASRPPQLYNAVQETAFFNLCKRVYGAGTTSELLEKASDLLMKSRLDIKMLLRSLLAAAVTEWALTSSLDAIGLARCKVLESYEKVIVARMPSPLRETFLRECRHTALKDNLSVNPTAFDLATRFKFVLSPLIHTLCIPRYNYTKGHRSKESSSRSDTESDTTALLPHTQAWTEGLQRVFAASLTLAAERTLSEHEPDFRWLRAGQQFDPEYMREEDQESKTYLGGDKVHVALSPILLMREEGKEENVVSRGLVLLQ